MAPALQKTREPREQEILPKTIPTGAESGDKTDAEPSPKTVAIVSMKRLAESTKTLSSLAGNIRSEKEAGTESASTTQAAPNTAKPKFTKGGDPRQGALVKWTKNSPSLGKVYEAKKTAVIENSKSSPNIIEAVKLASEENDGLFNRDLDMVDDIISAYEPGKLTGNYQYVVKNIHEAKQSGHNVGDVAAAMQAMFDAAEKTTEALKKVREKKDKKLAELKKTGFLATYRGQKSVPLLDTLRKTPMADVVRVTHGKAASSDTAKTIGVGNHNRRIGAVLQGVSAGEAGIATLEASRDITSGFSKGAHGTFNEKTEQNLDLGKTSFRLVLSVLNAVHGVYNEFKNAKNAGERKREALFKSMPQILAALSDLAGGIANYISYGKRAQRDEAFGGRVDKAKTALGLLSMTLGVINQGVGIGRALHQRHQINKFSRENQQTLSDEDKEYLEGYKKETASKHSIGLAFVPLTLNTAALISKCVALGQDGKGHGQRAGLAASVLTGASALFNAGASGFAFGKRMLTKNKDWRARRSAGKQAGGTTLPKAPPPQEGTQRIMSKLDEIADSPDFYVGYTGEKATDAAYTTAEKVFVEKDVAYSTSHTAKIEYEKLASDTSLRQDLVSPEKSAAEAQSKADIAERIKAQGNSEASAKTTKAKYDGAEAFMRLVGVLPAHLSGAGAATRGGQQKVLNDYIAF